jgi:regulatory protein YycI of two-component signal transduction system YycFG
MDWGRAKTVLIMSFLILNLLLAYQMWVTRWDPAILTTDMSGIKDETNKLLASKNIKVMITIPKEVPKLRQISVKFANGTDMDTVIYLDTPIHYSHLKNKSSLRELADKAGIANAASYELDESAGKEGLYQFDQMVNHVPMFDIYLQLISKNAEITGYKQAFVEVQSDIEQKPQKVISAYTALRSLAENYLPKGSVITDIRLGYHGQRFDSETHPMLPFWRVVLDKGDPYYVQAFSGAVEGNQDLPKS